jgi:hypothetical protein
MDIITVVNLEGTEHSEPLQIAHLDPFASAWRFSALGLFRFPAVMTAWQMANGDPPGRAARLRLRHVAIA